MTQQPSTTTGTAPVIPATLEIAMTSNLTGKTRSELIEMAQELSNENYKLFCDYNSNFIISKEYDAAYTAKRQAVLDQMKPILAALEPLYMAENCRSEAERLNRLGMTEAARPLLRAATGVHPAGLLLGERSGNWCDVRRVVGRKADQ